MQLLIQNNTHSPLDGMEIHLYEKARKLIHELASKQVLVPSHVIHDVSAFKLHWDDGMSELIERDYSVLESKDEATGLIPFMTFASNSSKSQNDADLNTLFEMIKKDPQSVRLYNTTNEQRDVMKKRGNEMTTDAYYDGTKRRKLKQSDQTKNNFFNLYNISKYNIIYCVTIVA